MTSIRRQSIDTSFIISNTTRTITIISDCRKAFKKTSEDRQDIHLSLELLRLYETYETGFEYIGYRLDGIED